MGKSHQILGGKVNIYKREGSDYWQCATFLAGRNRRKSTKQESLKLAKEFAEDWYLSMRGKYRHGEIRDEKSFAEAAEQFKQEYEIITEGDRNPDYVKSFMRRIDMYLLPFFGNCYLSEVNAGLVNRYRSYRKSDEKSPSRSTLHHEIVAIRQILKTAVRHQWIDHVPDLSMPYRKAEKITRRAWFSPEEYKQLYTASRQRAREAVGKSWQYAAEQLHDYILFMANTGLRPDEANNLEYRDVSIIHDVDTDETILLIEVRGKRGFGYCKSTQGALRPFQRLKERNTPKPNDKLFPNDHKKQFANLLEREGLRFDRDGQRRTRYSLRHTYICLRLIERADIYQIAKNCRTSVEMLHIPIESDRVIPEKFLLLIAGAGCILNKGVGQV